MFCTGGIRCEKFAPLMKELGFEEIYQLEGGILKYLEETPEKKVFGKANVLFLTIESHVDKNLKGGNNRRFATAFD